MCEYLLNLEEEGVVVGDGDRVVEVLHEEGIVDPAKGVETFAEITVAVHPKDSQLLGVVDAGVCLKDVQSGIVVF